MRANLIIAASFKLTWTYRRRRLVYRRPRVRYVDYCSPKSMSLTSCQRASSSPGAATSSPAGAAGTSSTAGTTPEPTEPKAASPSRLGKRKRDDEAEAPSQKKPKPSAGPSCKATAGLRNPSNRCYINSAMQILANYDPMAAHLNARQGRASSSINDELEAKLERGAGGKGAEALDDAIWKLQTDGDTFSGEVGRLIGKMRDVESKGALGSGRVHAFACILSGDWTWITEKQQDAGEYLSMALDKIAEEERAERARRPETDLADQTPSPTATKVEEVFCGKWRVDNRCEKCGATVASDEAFKELRLSLPGLDASARRGRDSMMRAGPDQDLGGRIAALGRPGHERRTCGKCGEQSGCQSRTFSELPEKLLLVVNQAGWDSETLAQYKDLTRVGSESFGVLDLSDGRGDHRYKLEQMAEHKGG